MDDRRIVLGRLRHRVHELPHIRPNAEQHIIEEKMKSGLFILDEPEAALSASKQLELLNHIRDAVNNGSQFILATHSPIIMGYPDARIYSFDGETVLPKRYEETNSYIINKEFLNNRNRMLDILFADEDKI